MRLWHIDLIPYLPKGQLLAQWRELNSIFKKQDKHILINYIYNYPKEYLLEYSFAVINEMQARNYKIKSFENYKNYFEGLDLFKFIQYDTYRFREHDIEYLVICYFNLKEKYLRGQKDFTKEIFEKLDKFLQKQLYLYHSSNNTKYGEFERRHNHE